MKLPSSAPESLPLGRWALQRSFLVRLAGFPYGWLDRLALSSAASTPEAFEQEFSRACAELRRLAAEPRFQEAVHLQSPEALANSIQGLLRHEGGSRNHRVRERERLVTAYLQRFCAKNDTHSFFGPTAAGFIDEGSGIRYRFELADGERCVYLAHWAAQALADALVAELPQLDRPRVAPSVSCQGTTMSLTAEENLGDADVSVSRKFLQVSVGEAGAALLRLADGTRTRKALLSQAAEQSQAEPEEVAGLLEELVRLGAIRAGLAIPSGHMAPLQFLRGELQHAPLGEAAQRWRESLEGLLAEQHAYRSRPDPERRELLSGMEGRFSTLTASSARRGRGQHYADRGLFSEECAAGLQEFRVGESALSGMTRGLDTLLDAISLPVLTRRWATRQWLARTFGPGPVRYVEVERRLLRELGAIEALRVEAPAQASVQRVRNLLEERIRGARGEPEVSVPAAELSAAMDPAHARDGIAVHASLDVLPIESAPGALRIVVGEVHTLFWTLEFMYWHLPEGPRLTAQRSRLLRELLGGRRAAEVVYRHTSKVDLRPPTVLDYELVVDGRAQVDPERVLRIADVSLVLEGEQVRFFEPRVGEFVPVAVGALPIAFQLLSPLFPAIWKEGGYFPAELLPAGSDTTGIPRLAIDELVIRRRSWRLTTAELQALLKDGGARAGERIRTHWELPRHVFYRATGEPKPMLIDFEAPHLVELFAHHIKRRPPGEWVGVSEMLPGPEQLLISGPDGKRTSEFRLCAWRRTG